MTIHKLTAGDGYSYLTRQVAGADVDREKGQSAADYYTAQGNPPGRWIGRGAPLLGLAGQQVTEEQMQALFGCGQHPDAAAIIQDYLTAHTRPGMTTGQLTRVRQDALKEATLGRPFPQYEPLDRFDTRVRQRLEIITEQTGREPTTAEVKKVHREEARRQRAAVAGFDAVFAPVKSAALLWALDERPAVRQAVRAAHEEAMGAAFNLLEQHAAYTRTGTGGIAQIETRGLIAAAFDHYDSRAGDPNLHTHVAISTKVQGVDGRWRSLDARGLYRMTVAASECYNTAFETALTGRLGVRFSPRPGTPAEVEAVREISDVPYGYIQHFSRRRARIEDRYTELIRDYRRAHGHDPPRAVCHQLARQANLDTRQGKKPPRSLAAMRAGWRDELTTVFGRRAITRLMAAVPAAGPPTAVPPAIDTHVLSVRTVANVSRQRSTWTVWNLRAEAERLARDMCTFRSADEHKRVVEVIVAEAVSPRLCLRVDAPALLDEPAALRRGDGASVFGQHAAERYTSQQVLDAEARLLAAARTPAPGRLAAAFTAAALDGFEASARARLDPGQRALATAFACDSRLLAVGLGPAGSGKTAAMRALAGVLRQGGQRLIPLATSAAAADVLGRELGVRADNLAKFLHEYTHGPYAAALRAGARVPAQVRLFALRPGDIVLVDEAGMAGTHDLDQLLAICTVRGAVVRLLGDHRQLSAVESGGALRLLTAEAGAVELTTLYRFRDPEEAAATLQLRTGDAAGLDYYFGRGRVRSGSLQAMTEVAYAGWKGDMLAGKTTLMAAAAGTDVTALAAQARTDRVEAGQVEPGGVTLQDGNLAGRGDWIITRQNNRRLTIRGGRDWVKNGDAWAVTSRGRDGSLRVRHLSHHGQLTLPGDYVQASVQLLYATTAHRAQGTTVDTAHPLITPDMTRESLYVIASRARECTTLYIATHELLPLDEDERLDQARTDPRSYAAREVLETVLAREGADLSATEAIKTSQELAGSLATLVPRYMHAARLLAERRYQDAAVQALGRDAADMLIADSAWGVVTSALQEAETQGWQPEQLLAAVVPARELHTAESIGAVIAWRIEAHIADQPAPPRHAQPTGADLRRYTTLLARIPAFEGMSLEAEAGTSRPDLPAVARPAQASTPAAADDYVAAVASVLGPQAAERARGEVAWPALEAALRRARRTGYSPDTVLTTVVQREELSNAASVSEVLAWRIGRYLETDLLPGYGDLTRQPDDTRSTLARALKAAENSGVSADNLIPHAAEATDLGEVLRLIRETAASQQPLAADGDALPPWVTRQIPAHGAEEIGRYVREAASVIAGRVRNLAFDAVRERPGWTSPLGAPPADPGPCQEWIRHIGVIVAYRDQYQITTDDPRQILGPYAEPGHAGHTAYWHAAASVLAARRLAGLEPDQLPGPANSRAWARVTADIYLALPDGERATIQLAMASCLGNAWFGATDQTDDHAVTRPAYGPCLAAVLAERGHLSTRCPEKVADQRSARVPLYVTDQPLEAAFARRRAPKKTTKRRHAPADKNHRWATPHGNTRPEPALQEPARTQQPSSRQQHQTGQLHSH